MTRVKRFANQTGTESRKTADGMKNHLRTAQKELQEKLILLKKELFDN